MNAGLLFTLSFMLTTLILVLFVNFNYHEIILRTYLVTKEGSPQESSYYCISNDQNAHRLVPLEGNLDKPFDSSDVSALKTVCPFKSVCLKPSNEGDYFIPNVEL
jgi:hypothetical protein